MLHAGQKVLDEDDVLLLAEVLEVCPHLVQRHHGLPVTADVLLQHLGKRNKTQVKNVQWEPVTQ